MVDVELLPIVGWVVNSKITNAIKSCASSSETREMRLCGTLEALVVANRGREFDGLGIGGAKRKNKQEVVWGTLEGLVVANSEREFFDGLGIEGAKEQQTEGSLRNTGGSCRRQ